MRALSSHQGSPGHGGTMMWFYIFCLLIRRGGIFGGGDTERTCEEGNNSFPTPGILQLVKYLKKFSEGQKRIG
jgi:hypothetical protein